MENQLAPTQYYILREEGTERPFTSPLRAEHRDRVFAWSDATWNYFHRNLSLKAGPAGRFFQCPAGPDRNQKDSMFTAHTEYHARAEIMPKA